MALPLAQGDIIVADLALRSIVRVDPTTGDRAVVSGCNDAGCSSQTGGGSEFLGLTGLARSNSLNPDVPLYVTDASANAVVRVDPVTGLRTVVSSNSVGGGPGFVSPSAISVQSNGDLLVADESLSALFEVDAATGYRTIVSGCSDASCSSLIGGGSAFANPRDITLDASGDALLLDTALNAVFRVDTATGNRSVVSSSTMGSGPGLALPQGIAFDANGQIWLTDRNVPGDPERGLVVRIDPLTGERTLVASASVGAGRDLEVPVGLALDASGNVVLVDFGPGIVLSVDSVSGDRVVMSSSVQGTGLRLSGPTNVLLLPVPEPGVALLLGLGLAVLSARRSRPQGH